MDGVIPLARRSHGEAASRDDLGFSFAILWYNSESYFLHVK